jgi:hypothetical protein
LWWRFDNSIGCTGTTLSIDDDVLLPVKERARREKRTVGAALSELARQALISHDASANRTA